MLSIYKASAGSGKTFALTQEYLRMMFTDKTHGDTRLPHSRILAVTFTKKSTAEMKERIMRELYILSTKPCESDYIKDFLEDENIGLDIDGIKQRAQELLIGILQNYNRFSVSTIDGFFQQVLRTFARELGLSTNYDLSLDANEIIELAADDILRKVKANDTQAKDVTQWLVEYIKNNINEDQRWNPLYDIRKFSKELFKESLIEQLPTLQNIYQDKLKIRDYQQQLKQIQKNFLEELQTLLDNIRALLYDIYPNYWNSKATGIFSLPAQEAMEYNIGSTLRGVFQQEIPLYKKPKRHEEEYIKGVYKDQVLPLILKIKDYIEGEKAKHYNTSTAILSKLETLGILLDIEKQIQDTNNQLRRLPISEINKMINQIIDKQEAPFIYERIGQRYQHYMIDEFQDTSQLQWNNFLPLIIEANSNGNHNMIVGDVKQSIYRFRNSDWKLLGEVHKKIGQHFFPDKDKTNKNWRTAPLVVKENEKLILRYSQHIVSLLWTKYPHTDNIGETIQQTYSACEMCQEPMRSYDGYYHMQFLPSKGFQQIAMEQLLEQLQSIKDEGIDLSRITLLTERNAQAKKLADYLIANGYNVQSAEGLRIESHKAVQIILHLLKLCVEPKNHIAKSLVGQILGELTETQNIAINTAKQLPLYDHVQYLIDKLELNTWENATPYLTAFQDRVYLFTQSKIADIELFLQYWERNKTKACIEAAHVADTVQITTIHSSKGLEFDIVIIPFFDWSLTKSHKDDIIWCKPEKCKPYDTLPLVPVKPDEKLANSFLSRDYILEMEAKYTDVLNMTYVALTRAKHRLYLYAPESSVREPSNIGQLIHKLYSEQNEITESNQYIVPAGQIPVSLSVADEKDKKKNEAGLPNIIIPSTYASVPLDNRLTLRSRSEDDFDENTDISKQELGILMHLWLSYIHTWQDVDSALMRIVIERAVDNIKVDEMRQQMTQLRQLIQSTNHDDWFSGNYHVLSEQDILIPSGNTQRPDRVMIIGNHAIIIDYKFGIERPSHREQILDYITLFSQMGYTTEGYIVYNELKTIKKIR